MNKAGKTIIVAGAFLALVLGILYGKGLLSVQQGMAPPKALAVLKLDLPPKAAPAAGFVDAKGDRFQLSQFQGRYVLLNLWATWCAPCVAELPALANLASRTPNLHVLAVDVGHDTPQAASAFLKAHKADSLGTFVDTDMAMIRKFGAYGLPMTVLIDPKGNVVAKAEGPADWDSPEALAYFKRITGS